MGAASTLFFSSNDVEKQTLHRRITPSDEQFEEQQERWNSLADFLIPKLSSATGCPIQTWLQGSYKFGTQVRPVRPKEEFDIDLGAYVVWDGDAEDGPIGPKAIKRAVQDTLEEYAQEVEEVVEVVPRKPRCSRIRFKGGFHIDVPSYHLNLEDERTLATERGWEASDPKAIYLWFRDSFTAETRAKVRRHIRYLKAWSALKFDLDEGRPSSILLTVLAAEAALELGELGPDDETLRDILAALIDRLEDTTEVFNPVNDKEDLNRLSDEENIAFVARLRDFAEVADRALEKPSAVEAADVWQEEFEHLFPMPEDMDDTDIPTSRLPTTMVSPEVRVSAVSETNPALSFRGLNAIGPIPKNCSITFELTNAQQFPRGSTVYWVVRNEGREAENTNDLGHIAGTGLTASEHSAYSGRHFMDCVVRIGRQTIAMRRIPVHISGFDPPRRNAGRPNWVKHRGSR